MSAVSEKQKSNYQTLGFALVENVVREPQLSALRDNLAELWRKAKRKQVKTIRVYEDFPHILGGVNVAGIDDALFNAPMLREWLPESGLDKILADLTGWRGAELELARIHMNDRFKYQGFWHRDAKVVDAETSVVAIVYFQDEEGFRIIPSGNKYSLATLPLGDEIQRQWSYEVLEGEHVVAAQAGSVFFMKSYLLHRGYNNKPRLHLHTRFIEADRYDTQAWSQYRNLEVAPYDYASSMIDRARTLVSYCRPRKNRSSLFQS
jgi:hypothetical protein